MTAATCSARSRRHFALLAGLLLLSVTGCQTTRESPQTAPAVAPSDPDRHYLYAGIPEITEYPHPLTVLTNLGYVAGYDEIRGVPAWVAYRVFAVERYLTHPRPSRFLVDGRTANRINHDHYTNSGYDRGHMAPNFAIVTRYGEEAQRKTFLMTNIVPQDPDLNRRIWKRLEGLIARDYSEAFNEVWVITGPVFTATGEWLKESLVKLPTHCFMVVKAEHQGKVMMKAFLVPQDVEGSEPLEEFLVSVREVEARTGLNFNPALDPRVAEILEGARPVELWRN